MYFFPNPSSPKTSTRPTRKPLAAALLSLSFGFSSAHAIDMVNAYGAALENSANLRSSIASREAVKYQTEAAKAGWLPQINGSVGISHRFGTQPEYLDHGLQNNWGINITQAIINPGLDAQIELAKINELKGELAYENTKMTLIYDVAKTYLDVLNIQEQMRSTDAQIKFLDSQGQTVMAQFNVGLVTSSDVLQVQAQLDQAKASQAANQAQLTTALGEFYRVTGQSEKPNNSTSINLALPEIKPTEIDYWVDETITNNLQIRQSELDLQSADANLDAVEAQNDYTLGLSGGYGGEFTDGLENDSGQIGLTLNIPIYTGGAHAAQTKAAAYNRESVRYTKTYVTDQVTQQVRAQYYSLQAQKQQLGALARAIRSNQVALESIQAGYEVGIKTISDLLSASSNLRTSETNFVLARQNYLLSVIAFKQSVGSLSPQDLAEIDAALAN